MAVNRPVAATGCSKRAAANTGYSTNPSVRPACVLHVAARRSLAWVLSCGCSSAPLRDHVVHNTMPPTAGKTGTSEVSLRNSVAQSPAAATTTR